MSVATFCERHEETFRHKETFLCKWKSKTVGTKTVGTKTVGTKTPSRHLRGEGAVHWNLSCTREGGYWALRPPARPFTEQLHPTASIPVVSRRLWLFWDCSHKK
jgi:hypothetical protein